MLVLMVIGVHANSLSAPFLFDDYTVIVQNPGIGFLSDVPFGPRAFYRFSMHLNYLVSGANPLPYRAVNMILHAATALFFWGILRRTFAMGREGTGAERWGEFSAWAAAALWAVHPLQTESVTYVCQRSELIAGFCVMSSVYLFIRGATATIHSGPWFRASIAVCMLGAFAKQTAVVVPALLLVYDAVFLSGGWRNVFRSRGWVHGGMMLVLPLLVVMQLFDAADAREQETWVTSDLSPARYLLSQGGVILHYLRLSVWPYPLCLDYAWSPATWSVGSLLPAVVVGAVFAVGMALMLRLRPAGVCAVAFFGALAPTSSVFPLVDLAFEHRMYLPLAGLAAFAAGLLVYLPGRLMLAPVTAAIRVAFVLLIAVFGAMSVARNMDYGSEERMWRSVLKVRPANLRARNTLAAVLSEAGRSREAVAEYLAVLAMTRNVPFLSTMPPKAETDPVAPTSDRYNRFLAFSNMGLMLFRDGRYKEAEASYVLALRLFPFEAGTISKLRRTLTALGVEASTMPTELPRRIWSPEFGVEHYLNRLKGAGMDL